MEQPKEVSLTEIYQQVQEMMTEAGIPNASMSVSGTVRIFEHQKTGKYNSKPQIEPDKLISIWINEEGRTSIHSEHWSIKVVMATVEAALDKRKHEKAANPADKVEQIVL